MKFIVNRSKWYRGQGCTESLLLREDGTRCCIGFVGQQCGIPDASLLGRKAVIRPYPFEEGWPKWMMKKIYYKEEIKNILDIGDAYGINDDPDIDDVTREQKLKEAFAQNGDEIEFVDSCS